MTIDAPKNPDQRGLPLGLPARIPVARVSPGPSGVDWHIDALLVGLGDHWVPGFILRPCVQWAFVSSEVARLRRGRGSSGLDRLLLRRDIDAPRDPRPLDWAAAELLDPVASRADIELRDPKPEAATRAFLRTAQPWTLLTGAGPDRLGMRELAEMDPIDAALIALLDLRPGTPARGRHTGRAVPRPEADLMDVLVALELSPQDAAARIEAVPRAPGRPGTPSSSALLDARTTAARARQRGPRAVFVHDTGAVGVLDLRSWLRSPRAARLLRVVTGAGPVEHLRIGISDPSTLNGWMDARSLPFHIVEAPLPPDRDPPITLALEDIDRDKNVMRLYGFAETEAELLARHAR